VTERQRGFKALRLFREGPASVRNAIRVVVAASILTTIAGGVLAWLFDRQDFATIGDAMWWSLQTVTTVGYGDITPKTVPGRLIGAAYLLYAVAFLTILSAAITTSLIERRRREGGPDVGIDAVLQRLDDITARLDRIEHDATSARDGTTT
jgi:voltage-gated potassium channel